MYDDMAVENNLAYVYPDGEMKEKETPKRETYSF